MRTKSRIREGGLVLAVLTLIVSMPDRAEAQQSGLFPLAPIRRQRVPCDQEDPVYKIYKEKYFGYHPSCWRAFPSGWGCPSPEKGDVEKSFKERKLGAGLTSPEGESEEMQPEDMGQERPNIPAVPSGVRSPFEQPVPPGNNQPTPAAPRQNQGQPSPFDQPAPNPGNNSGAASAAPRPGRMQPVRPAAGEGTPELTAPEQPARRDGTQASRLPRNDDGPILSVGDISTLPPSHPDDPFTTSHPAQNDELTADASTAQPTPANAAPRRGFLSSLFNNLGWNRVRR